MNETDMASIHSISRAEILTSCQAIQMEMAVTRKARNAVERPWPVVSRNKRFA
jgi:hypothetical protein